jgi:hypothetical protein
VGEILGDAMLRGETTNPDAYVRMLTELRKRFKPVRTHTNPTYTLLQPMPMGMKPVKITRSQICCIFFS